jgi:hypothetical protein
MGNEDPQQPLWFQPRCLYRAREEDMLSFDLIPGSRTRLVMQMAHWRRPLALASPSRVFALTRATVSRSQADPVFFLLTKPVREPRIASGNEGFSFFWIGDGAEKGQMLQRKVM